MRLVLRRCYAGVTPVLRRCYGSFRRTEACLTLAFMRPVCLLIEGIRCKLLMVWENKTCPMVDRYATYNE